MTQLGLFDILPGMDDIQTFPLPGCREPLSSMSHFFGAIVFAGFAIVLIRRGRGDVVRRSSLAVMAVSSILLLTLSGLYHLFWPGPMREFMVRADISAIFLLIAGSMTPVYAILFEGLSRWLPLVFIWTFAVAGILLRMVFFDLVSGSLGIGIFLIFGWTGVIIFVVLWRRLGWSFVQPAFYAGVAYTLGALVLLFHGPTLLPGVLGPHEFWHLAVLSGLAFHWRFVFQFAAGPNLIQM